ncbi:Abi family protein [Gordonibacter sp. RACS_AR68]|jgi:abortive infection bacteriophage resistance protein|uniref:Abi family protein n=1 Tax=Gordonibacter sp. RACS_AR68 TaxID=2872005 RepID=UPI00261E6235|nr:Abi family protein [Gordonibacter sp. RACS_AR68]MDN4468886.1 Abi family protein [Gordonibacter sp. RACS_AR68]
MEKTDKTYTAWGIDSGAHEARGLKPMLTPEEQVTLLKAKGVTFERCTEAEAIAALTERDSFLHIASYRKLFQKHQDGEKEGQYVRLDFADLLNLDALDARLRSAFQSVAYDIERVAKARLIERISLDDSEDGYAIVAEFMASQQKRYRNSIESNLKVRMVEDAYTGALIARYAADMPVWVFLEVVSFGALLAFYLFCAERWNDEEMRQEHYAMKGVKAVRNCCSHGACVVNGFDSEHDADTRASSIAYEWLDSKGLERSGARKAKLRNRRIQQLLETLVMFERMGCASSSRYSVDDLRGLKGSISEVCEKYGEQNAFVSYLGFLARLIDKSL